MRRNFLKNSIFLKNQFLFEHFPVKDRTRFIEFRV